MKGNKIFLSLFIGITLLFDPFFVVLAAVQNTGHLADSGAGETETIKVISPEDYIPQDKFWPIIKREVQSYI